MEASEEGGKRKERGGVQPCWDRGRNRDKGGQHEGGV